MTLQAERARAQAEPAPMRVSTGRKWLRRVVNCWVFFHFSAILTAAATSGPSSDLIYAAWRVFRPYLQFLYLNHGYNFFAPEPAPSTLLNFVAERDDGTSVPGRIPDGSLEPRLLFHRYLLLTEHIGIAPADLQENWYKSYARHLCRKYGAARVRLTRLTHYPASMEWIRDGGQLDNPASYDEMDLGVFPCGEL
jgi:hypothetical protein